MEPVFIVDDLQKKQFLEGTGVRSCVCTNGLLYDLPPPAAGVCVDNDDGDFKMTCVPKDPRRLAALEQYRASPIVIVTSPTEDGARTAAQVLKYMGQPADASAHIAPAGLDASTNLLWFELKQKVNPLYVAQGEARRIIDRLSGFMLTEYLGHYLEKTPLPLEPTIDRYGAHILCILAAHLNEKIASPVQRVYLKQQTGFHAVLVNATEDSDLSTLEPANFSPEEARSIAEAVKRSPGRLINQKAVARPLPPSQPFRFQQAVAYARAAGQIQFGDICNRLTELYSSGLTTHFLPLKSDNVDALLGSLQTVFKGIHPGMQKEAAAALQCRGLIRPRIIRRGDDLNALYPAVASLYSHIQSHTINMVRQELTYVSNHSLFQFGDHYFLGQEPQELSEAYRNAGFFLQPGAPYRDGAPHTIRVGPADGGGNQSSPAPELERFFSLFRRQFNGPNMLSSLQSLITRGYLTFEDNKLAFTERGHLCMGVLEASYWVLLRAGELETTEHAIRAIGMGLMDKTYFLHEWFTRFKSHHEVVLKVFKKK